MYSAEDLFTEEAEEDLERIIERDGEENIGQDQDEPNEGGDNEGDQNEEAEEAADTKTVKPKRVVRNPQPKLNEETLRNPKGLLCLESMFERVKFKGRGYEEQDLNVLMKTYEYWCHRMFPKYPFDDSIAKLEKLGTKKPVQAYLKRIRLGMLTDSDYQPEVLDNAAHSGDSDIDDENAMPNYQNNTPDDNLGLNNTEDALNNIQEDPFDSLISQVQKPIPAVVELTEEQLKRMQENKERAERLRQERIKKLQQKTIAPSQESTENTSIENSQNNKDISGSQEVLENQNEASSANHNLELPSDHLGQSETRNENFTEPESQEKILDHTLCYTKGKQMSDHASQNLLPQSFDHCADDIQENSNNMEVDEEMEIQKEQECLQHNSTEESEENMGTVLSISAKASFSYSDIPTASVSDALIGIGMEKERSPHSKVSSAPVAADFDSDDVEMETLEISNLTTEECNQNETRINAEETVSSEVKNQAGCEADEMENNEENSENTSII